MSDQIEVVPFAQAKLPPTNVSLLIDGKAVALSDDRKIEIWKIVGDPGVAIRIFRRTEDDKISKLQFSLSPDAGRALAHLLIEQLGNKTE